MEPEPKAPVGLSNTPEQHIPNFRDRLQRESSSDGQAIVSDSWEKIARWIGAEPKIMQASIDEYNVFCDMGRDTIFAKDKKYLIPLRRPPYYATRFGPGAVDTAGPVRVNERMEALDQKDNPIPGLYVAGVLAAGWCGYDYHHFGCALSWALNSGRIAGESAAKYVFNQES